MAEGDKGNEKRKAAQQPDEALRQQQVALGTVERTDLDDYVIEPSPFGHLQPKTPPKAAPEKKRARSLPKPLAPKPALPATPTVSEWQQQQRQEEQRQQQAEEAARQWHQQEMVLQQRRLQQQAVFQQQGLFQQQQSLQQWNANWQAAQLAAQVQGWEQQMLVQALQQHLPQKPGDQEEKKPEEKKDQEKKKPEEKKDQEKKKPKADEKVEQVTPSSSSTQNTAEEKGPTNKTDEKRFKGFGKGKKGHGRGHIKTDLELKAVHREDELKLKTAELEKEKKKLARLKKRLASGTS